MMRRTSRVRASSPPSIWLACSNREAYGVPPLGGEASTVSERFVSRTPHRLKAELHTLRDSNTLTRILFMNSTMKTHVALLKSLLLFTAAPLLAAQERAALLDDHEAGF